ncbi:hypothetical protein ACFZB9_34660 [Kitasatospora sp. NPDC008050]|uniref:hypothetical protein n=1 Tax=Kitasatospora sp. NPDC008050 TaxID=3364021 RepID=UPI0036F05548
MDRRRLLAVCAVLFGLFLMHGTPATAASGCHGGMPVTAGVSEAGGVVAHPMAVPTAVPAAAPAGGSLARPAVMAQPGGAVCVAAPARGGAVLAAAGLLALAVLAVVADRGPGGRHPGASAHRRRGPPSGGRALLLQVCIART